MDELESTDVSDGSPSVSLPESTGDAAPSVSTEEGVSQVPASGDVTAQPAVEDTTEEVDPFEGVPSLEELQSQAQQKVPHSEALLRLRTALEARNSELEGLKPLESFKSLSELGEPDAIKSAVETQNLLFSPVINPATQQPEIDPQTGLPRVTARPFIERVDSENPGMAEVLALDALNYTVDFGNGQKVPIFKIPEIQNSLLKAYGLDPERLNDYQNIDALSQSGEITQEELTNVPEEFHDAYKQLPPGVRNDLQQQDADTRRFNLEAHRERFDRKAQEQQQRQQMEATERQQREAAQAYVSTEQEKYVKQELHTGLASVMDDLASKVTFSQDPTENSRMLGITEGFVFALRDPDFPAEKILGAFGTKLDPSFQQALQAAEKHYRDAKAFELFGQKGRAQAALILANNAKTQVYAKIAPLALQVAKSLGGQVQQKANQRNGLLEKATNSRPVPTGSQAEGNGSGMLPNAEGYGVQLFKQLQAQKGA